MLKFSSFGFILMEIQLDGYLLLASANTEDPDEIVHSDLTSLGISTIDGQDFLFFSKLQSIDLSDNKLKDSNILSQFANLPLLKTLSLACNYLTEISSCLNPLLGLEFLDLSYNQLPGDILYGLMTGCPNVQVLNLSSNCISSIPKIDGSVFNRLQ